jgi:hypothetical protein
MALGLTVIERANSAGDNPATFPAIDRLRPHLANLMGDGGVRALLARSLVLAAAEAPWLQVLHVNANGHFDGLEAIADDLESAVFTNGKVVLLAQLIGLLVALIGPRCLIPRFDGAILSSEWKEAMWDRYVTGAPRPRTPSEQQYSDRKLRSRR